MTAPRRAQPGRAAWLVRGLVPVIAGLLCASPAAATPEAVFSHTFHTRGTNPCRLCHLDMDPDEPPVSRTACETCHPTPPPPWRLSARARRLAIARFDHPPHLKRFDCRACHLQTATDTQPDGLRIADPEACLACHEHAPPEAPRLRQCARCHGADLKSVPPLSHDGSWAADHGATLGDGLPTGHGLACSTCHQPAFCMGCHQQKKALYHARHLQQRGARCADCHAPAQPDALPTVREEGCRRCHVPGPIQTTRIQGPRARRLQIRFPHAKHERRLACPTCHQATMADAQGIFEPMMSQKTCTNCHAHIKGGPPLEQCARCHGIDKTRVRPQSHTGTWIKRHGPESRWRVEGEHSRHCWTCHTRSRCETCHASQRPRTHTALWRARTHGVAASWDRERCNTCHETGACRACHQRTAPLNHRGSWPILHGLAAQARDNERCAVCHDLGWCAACHNSRRTR